VPPLPSPPQDGWGAPPLSMTIHSFSPHLSPPDHQHPSPPPPRRVTSMGGAVAPELLLLARDDHRRLRRLLEVPQRHVQPEHNPSPGPPGTTPPPIGPGTVFPKKHGPMNGWVCLDTYDFNLSANVSKSFKSKSLTTQPLWSHLFPLKLSETTIKPDRPSRLFPLRLLLSNSSHSSPKPSGRKRNTASDSVAAPDSRRPRGSRAADATRKHSLAPAARLASGRWLTAQPGSWVPMFWGLKCEKIESVVNTSCGIFF